MPNKIFNKFIPFLKIVLLIFASIGLFSFSLKASAATINTGHLEITYPGSGAVFSEMPLAPGASVSKLITVTNISDAVYSFALSTNNVSGDLISKIFIEPEVAGAVVWTKTINELANLPNGSQTVVPNMAPGETIDVNLRATLDQNLGNDYEDKFASFDLIFGSELPTGQQASTLTTSQLPSLTTVRQQLSTTLGRGIGQNISPTAPTTEPAVITPTEPTPETVKGVETEKKEEGENWLLWLIIPGLLILGILFMKHGLFRNIGLPIIGAIVAAILTFYTTGNIPTLLFWLVLLAELIWAILLAQFIFRRKLESEDAKG